MDKYYLHALNHIYQRFANIKYHLKKKINKHNECLSGGSISTVAKNIVERRNELIRMKRIFPYIEKIADNLAQAITQIEEIHSKVKDYNMTISLKSIETAINEKIDSLKKILFDEVTDPDTAEKVLANGGQEWTAMIVVYQNLIRNSNDLIRRLQDAPREEKMLILANEIPANTEECNRLIEEVKQMNFAYEMKVKELLNHVIIPFETVPELPTFTPEREDVIEYVVRIDHDTAYPPMMVGNIEVINHALSVIDSLVKDPVIESEPDNYIVDKKMFDNIYTDVISDIFKMEGGKPITDVIRSEGEDNVIFAATGVKIDSTEHLAIQEYNLGKLIDKLHQINLELEKLSTNYNHYVQMRIRYTNHVIFLILITTSDTLVKKRVFYQMINKGAVQFYYRIASQIMNRIEQRDKDPIIRYFDRNHYFTLRNLITFLRLVRDRLKTMEVVKISDELPDKFKIGFLLLNHFKDILEAYHETFSGKVSIIARINDFSITKEAPRLFIDHRTDPQILNINHDVCRSFSEESIPFPTVGQLKFTEVFGTEEYPDPFVISKYMTLETKIAKGKGIMLMTYGYSGVGKTFTLFGGNGILVSTLKNIRGVASVRFRVYEIHGIGSLTSEVWKDPKLIEQNLYHYPIQFNSITGLSLQRDDATLYHGLDGIHRFIDSNSGFFLISDPDIAHTAFNHFSDMVDAIDRIRIRNSRITMTPNNPESSRSLMVYDFRIVTDGKEVPFVIVDLPGREEVISTYVDPYLERYFIRKYLPSFDIYRQWYRAFLSSITLNPILAPVFASGQIIAGYNKIATAPDPHDLTGKSYGEVLMSRTTETIAFADEVATDMQTNNRVGDIVTIGQNFTIKMKTNSNNPVAKKYPGYYSKTVQLKKFTYDNPHQVSKFVSPLGYQTLVAIHLINRILTQNRFDILRKVMEFVVEDVINSHLRSFIDILTQGTIDEKRRFLSRFMEESVVAKIQEHQLNERISNAVLFTHLTTPYEGLYINENIIGLIKFLTKDVMGKPDDVVRERVAPPQDIEKLSFGSQRKLARQKVKEAYVAPVRPRGDNEILDQNFVEGKATYVPIETWRTHNIFFDTAVIDDIMKYITSSYSSKRIFNYDDPIFKTLFGSYIAGTEDTVSVTEFQLFYLMSNTRLTIDIDGHIKDLKCRNQLRLLMDTIGFVQMVSESDE